MKTISKKGQLTLFVIIAIIVVVAISSYVIFKNTATQNKYDPKVTVLKDNLLECFKEKYQNAIEITAYQGGYSEKPNTQILETQTTFIPYYFYTGEDTFPTIETIETEIGKRSQNTIQNCIEEYQEDETFTLSNNNNLKIFVKIEETTIQFTTDIELTVEYDNKTAIIEFIDFQTYIDSKLQDMYQVAQIIVNQANTDPEEWIDLTEIYEEVTARNLNATILELEEDTTSTLFIIETNEPYIYPSKLQFLHKYKLDDIGFPLDLDQ